MAGLIPVTPSHEDSDVIMRLVPVAGFIASSFIMAGLGGVATAYAIRSLEHHKQTLLVRHPHLLPLG